MVHSQTDIKALQPTCWKGIVGIRCVLSLTKSYDFLHNGRKKKWSTAQELPRCAHNSSHCQCILKNVPEDDTFMGVLVTHDTAVKRLKQSSDELSELTALNVACLTRRHNILFLMNYSVAHFLTYLLTPWSRILLEKPTGLQLVKKFPAFYGTRRFITAFTNARHLSLSWASTIQSIPPHPTYWRLILTLFSHLRLGLPSGLFPSGFPTKTLYTPLLSPIRATCHAHLILLDFITRTILDEDNICGSVHHA